MKALGYQVLKGRGVAFIDDKKVKIKGSEAGFSLMKIEKVLAMKKETESKEAVKELQHKVLQKQQGKDTRQPLSATSELLFKKQKTAHEMELQKQITELVYGIAKPENIPEQFLPELLKKRRVKKHRKLNL